jgi:hypothetical protein
MRPWLHIGIPVAIGVAAVSFVRNGNGYDPDHPSFLVHPLDGVGLCFPCFDYPERVRPQYRNVDEQSNDSRRGRINLVILGGIAVKVWTALR